MGVKIQVRVTHSTLRVRNGPGVNFNHIGNLQAGAVLNVRTVTGKDLWVGFDPAMDIAGTDVWVEFEPGKWAAYAFRGERYMVLNV